jgi:hypothetical protein
LRPYVDLSLRIIDSVYPSHGVIEIHYSPLRKDCRRTCLVRAAIKAAKILVGEKLFRLATLVED